MKRLLTLMAILASLALSLATAWEREVFEVLKQTVREQAEQEQAEREQAEAERERAERAEQRELERERKMTEQRERERAEREREQNEDNARPRFNAYEERQRAIQAERERQDREWLAEYKREQAEQRCNGLKELGADASTVEYAHAKGVLTPAKVKDLMKEINACVIPADTGAPSCKHYLFAMKMQEHNTLSDRQNAIEAESTYKQMKYAKSKGLLTPSDEMKIGNLKKDMREKAKSMKASQRKFETLYHEAEEAGCIDE